MKEINFDEGARELHSYVDFMKGSKFLCPNCGKEHCSVHDTIEKVWHHLDFFNVNLTFISILPRLTQIKIFLNYPLLK